MLAVSSQPTTPIDFTLPETRPGLRALWAVNYLTSRCWHDLTIHTPCVIPRHGPAILTCNHISGIDPMLVQAASRRPIVWMMAGEYYEMKSMGWVYRTIGNIPVSRGGRDMAAMRHAMRALQCGRVLGIFPEGRISPTREYLPFQTGVALIAMRMGVNIYPASLEGTQRNKGMVEAFIHRQRAEITFGEPIRFSKSDPDRRDINTVTAELQTITERLRDSGR